MPPKRWRSSSPGPALAARFLVEREGAEPLGFVGVEVSAIGREGGGELRLTRAVDGRRDLLDWLRPPAGRRRAGVAPAVRVRMLDAGGRAVCTWLFHGVEPVSLALSPLSAMAEGLMTETLTLAFADVSAEP